LGLRGITCKPCGTSKLDGIPRDESDSSSLLPKKKILFFNGNRTFFLQTQSFCAIQFLLILKTINLKDSLQEVEIKIRCSIKICRGSR
jgi:hypothetical protein